MANYVYNDITVRGTKEALTAFMEKASKPYQSEWRGAKNAEGVYDTELIVEATEESDLSFWNFVRPEEEILPVYFGHIKADKPEGYDDWDASAKMVHDFKFLGNNSWDWNVRNWGVRSEASDVGLTDNLEDTHPSLDYSFQTPWNIPEQVFRAICEQHPELSFEFESEEEQGWGAKYESSKVDDAEDGEPTSTLLLIEEWDIPESHADYVNRGREENCSCQQDDEEEDWYEDCPRPETDFIVVVERRYIVRATTAESAWEIAQDQLDTLTPEDLDTSWVVDENSGERLFPIFKEEEE